MEQTHPHQSHGDDRSQSASVRDHRTHPQFCHRRQARRGQAQGIVVRRLRCLQGDRRHRLHFEQSARFRTGETGGRHHRQNRRRPAAGRLLEHLLHAGEAGRALEKHPRRTRIVLRRPSHRSGGGVSTSDRQTQAARRGHQAGRSHRQHFRSRQEGGHVGPRRDRVGPGEVISGHEAETLFETGPVFSRRARPERQTEIVR